MGCDVGCPFIGREFDENWQLPDPTGKSDEEFLAVMDRIEQNVKAFICGFSGNMVESNEPK